MSVLKKPDCAGESLSSGLNHYSLGRWWGIVLIALLLGAGCRREEISVYRVPKDSENPQTMAGTAPQAMPPGHPSVASANPAQPTRIKYEMPAGWSEKPPTEMSVALFSIGDPKGELSVMSFPGEGAGRLDLINIVRSESGLPPLNDEQLAKLVETVPVGSEKGSLIDLTAGTSTNTAAPASRVLVTVLPHEGVTWFFKMSGPTEVVAAQKPTMLNFLKSISFVAGAPAAPAPQMADANTTPGQMTPESSAGLQTPTISDSEKPTWTPPATWKEVPPTQMLLAKFVIEGADGYADLKISQFPGDVGGLLQNVNRWRNMVGLAPVDRDGLDAAYSPLDVNGVKTMLVDVNGKDPKTGKDARLIGVIWPRKGQTWFYKFMGDSAVVNREKDAFIKFIQSVRYPNA